ncbi:MAG: iron ABC transporter permease [Candidatus Obscuribacter sp.]|nr:iron ABC transporter permease [Candidatus Obscuribacter sp.]MBP6351693.1 iron ABC transporter permease [Candidatus Obscuribacter sp.]
MPLRLFLLTIAVLLLMVANLCMGDVVISPRTLWSLFNNPAALSIKDTAIATVISEIRWPRMLTAALVGLSLSVAGYLLQKLSRNDLADPYLTGVASGAAVGAAFAIFGGLDFALMPTAALIGGAATSALVILLSRTGSASLGDAGISIPRLLLSGIALSSISSAAINLVLSLFSSQTTSQGLNLWLLGGISGRSWSELTPNTIFVSIGLIIAFATTKQLKLLSLGEEQAASLGLNVKSSQLWILAAAIILTAAAVSLSGLVGFVGLIGPQIARRFVGGTERLQLVASALSGALLTLVADLMARTLVSGQELPLGSLMALGGGPVFIFLLAKNLDRVQAR